jgi:hypothetical protein
MGNFQQSGFLGFSSRTLLVSLVVAGIVVGLFFIPSTVKFLVANRGQRTAQQAQAPATTVASTERRGGDSSASRSSLSPQALQSISETLDSNTQARPPSKKKSDVSDAKGEEGLFSNWDFKVKAGGTSSSSIAIPAGIRLDRLSSREAQTFFKRSRGHIARFQNKNFRQGGEGREAIASFLTGVDAVIRGVPKGSNDEKEVGALLKRQHVVTLRTLSAVGADRGQLLEWLSLPLVRFVDIDSGVDALEKVTDIFTPRLVLRSINIRQRAGRYDGANRIKATLQAEVAVQGSDVQSISVYQAGKVMRDVKPPRADASGFRVFKVRGDATGVWSFVINDKYGAPAYRKSYAFYPRVYNFRQKRDGTFDVAFAPGSASNSLDRFFFVGAGGGSLGSSSDSVMSKF